MEEKTHKIRNDLISFINTHPNWREDLHKPPYNFKVIRNNGPNKNWYCFNYRHFTKGYTNDLSIVARGLILEIIDNKVKRVISHGFDQFVNYIEGINENYIDWNNSELYEKIDGQLLKCSKIDGKIYWFCKEDLTLDKLCDIKNSQYSNTSDILNEALFKNKNNEEPKWYKKLPENWTVMFELTTSFITILCHFDETKLWLLGGRDPNGLEQTAEYMRDNFNIDYDIPQKFEAHSLDEAKQIVSTFNENQEGVVIKEKTIRNGEFSYRRLKLKSQFYIDKKFNVGKNISDQKIFDSIINDEIDDLIAYKKKIKERAKKIRDKIEDLKEKILILKKNNIENNNDEVCLIAQNWISFKHWLDSNRNDTYVQFLNLCEKIGI